jgi:hypothetical protein
MITVTFTCDDSTGIMGLLAIILVYLAGNQQTNVVNSESAN